MSKITRRRALQLFGTSAALAGAGSLAMPSISRAASGHVVVVGGGFGGATAAKYLKRADSNIRVTLVEPAQRFYTCPFSNLYLGGLRSFESIGHGYDALKAMGIDVVHAMAEDVNAGARTVRLAGGRTLNYDKLVLSPGIDIRWGAIAGYDESASTQAPHAWKAGSQTQLLKRQLDLMPDGGVFIMAAPDNPYRCPPGPYERVSMIAHYLKTNKPKSKILVLDAKENFSKQALFMDGWKALYGSMIEWVPQSKDGKVVRVDAGALEVETEFGTKHKASVLNVVPPQKAGVIAERAGVTAENGWVPVNPSTFASTKDANIYVVGDATVAAPMPKSGFCANAQGKVAAAAIAATLDGKQPVAPHWLNTCYSMVAPDYAISVAGVYRVADGKIIEVPNSGGVSPRDADAAFRQREAEYSKGWYAAITQDTWGTA